MKEPLTGDQKRGQNEHVANQCKAQRADEQRPEQRHLGQGRRHDDRQRRKRGRKPKEADPSVDPDTVANTTDPQSGILKTRRGWVQGYNAQAVVTTGQIILAADVTTQANDVRQLTGMLDQAQANIEAVLGEEAVLGAAVADAGYWSEANAARRCAASARAERFSRG